MSSYNTNTYFSLFNNIPKILNSRSFLEVGVLDGFSAYSFSYNNNFDQLTVVDLFEDYQFKNANYQKIISKLKPLGFKIVKDNFYKYHKKIKKNYDIIHIDISNDGDVYLFALKFYFKFSNQILILEGGSQERDKIDWMVNYDKTPISPLLKRPYFRNFFVIIIKEFPSCTIIFKKSEYQIYKNLTFFLKSNSIDYFSYV